VNSITITNPKELEQLRDSSKSVTEFTLAFVELTEKQNLYFQRKLQANYFSCGCELGTYSLIVSILLTPFFLYYPLTNGQMLVKEAAIIGLFLPSTSLLVGKLLGLIFAKYRLSVVIKELQQQIN